MVQTGPVGQETLARRLSPDQTKVRGVGRDSTKPSRHALSSVRAEGVPAAGAELHRVLPVVMPFSSRNFCNAALCLRNWLYVRRSSSSSSSGISLGL